MPFRSLHSVKTRRVSQHKASSEVCVSLWLTYTIYQIFNVTFETVTSLTQRGMMEVFSVVEGKSKPCILTGIIQVEAWIDCIVHSCIGLSLFPLDWHPFLPHFIRKLAGILWKESSVSGQKVLYSDTWNISFLLEQYYSCANWQLVASSLVWKGDFLMVFSGQIYLQI